MKTKVYRFDVLYKGLENKINRTIDASENYQLSKLGYAILASFETLAYHLFFVECDGVRYEIPMNEEFEDKNTVDPRSIKLKQMGLEPGSSMTMIYDYGCEQEFYICLVDVFEMDSGTSSNYPRVVSGKGKGIIDDMPADALKKVINRIDKNGESNQMYRTPYDTEEVWDYRKFDLQSANTSLKSDINAIARGYEKE